MTLPVAPQGVEITPLQVDEDENFQHYEYDYWIKFLPVSQFSDPQWLTNTLRELFTTLISEIVTRAKTFEKNVKGYLQVSLDSPDFPAIHIPFVSIQNVAESSLQLQRDISKRVQSSRNFNLNNGFRFSATMQHIGVGGGRPTRVRNLASDMRLRLLKRKRSIIFVPETLPDGLCLPAVLIIGMDKVKGVNVTDCKRSKTLQERCQLMLEAGGVSAGQLGPDHLSQLCHSTLGLGKFDTSLWRLDGERLLFIKASQVEEGTPVLYLDILLEDGHYYLITSLEALLNCRFFCRMCCGGRQTRYHYCPESGCVFTAPHETQTFLLQHVKAVVV